MVSNESPQSAAGMYIQLDVPPLDFGDPAVPDVREDGTGQSDVVNLMHC